MHVEYHALRQLCPLGVADSSLNMLKQLTDHQNVLAYKINQQLNTTMQANFLQAFNMIQDESDNEENIHHFPLQSNTVQHVPPELMRLISALQKKVEQLSPASIKLQKPKYITINPKTIKLFKCYFWSCGCCPHWGHTCGNKKSGHKDEARFKDRMGGGRLT